MPRSKVTFHGVSQTVFNCLRAKVQQAGVTIPATSSGVASDHGVDLNCEFDASAETLGITVTRKPFLVSCGNITSAIHHEVMDCGGQ